MEKRILVRNGDETWSWSLLGLLGLFSKRRWVTILPNGFAISDRHGDHTFTNDDLISLSQSFTPCFGNQRQVKWQLRRLVVSVKTESGTKRIGMVNFIKAGQPDPLETLITRCAAHLLESARQTIEQGGSLEGDGWLLNKSEFRIGDPAQQQAFRLPELNAVAVVDNQICVWQRGKAPPVIRIPAESENYSILKTLLAEQIPFETDELLGDGLGRIQFERHGDRNSISTIWFNIILGVAIGIGLLIHGLLSVDCRQETIGVGIFNALAGGVSWWRIWPEFSLRNSVFHGHSRGVTLTSKNGIETLRFVDVEGFSFSAKSKNGKNHYLGTTYKLACSACDGTVFRFCVTRFGDDEQLDRLRDHLALIVANRMLQELAERQMVNWISDWRFVLQGLEFTPASSFISDSPFLIPYGSIVRQTLEAGEWSLFTANSKFPAISLRVDCFNFYPGHALFAHLLEERDPAGDALQGPIHRIPIPEWGGEVQRI